MKTKFLLVGAVLATAILCSASLVGAQTTGNLALIAQLQAQIQALTQQIAQLQAAQSATSTSTTTWCHTFNTNLGFANTGSDEVTQLHTALQKEGISYGADASTTYAEDTAAAVVQFQDKYGIKPAGYVGPLTRTKLNSLYGCTTTSTTTPSTTSTPPIQALNSSSSGTAIASKASFDGSAVYDVERDLYSTTSTGTTLSVGLAVLSATEKENVSGIDFDVSNVPVGATITDVKLNIYWNSLKNAPKRDKTFFISQQTIKANTETAAEKFNRWIAGKNYYSTPMSGIVVGSASYDLGSSAITDMQAATAAGGGKLFTVGLSTSNDDAGLYSSPNTISSSEATSNKPTLTITYTIAPSTSGNVWIANTGSNTFTKLSSSGDVIGTYPAGSDPYAVAVDASGNVWVTSSYSNTVTKLSSSGSIMGAYPAGNDLNCIAIDASGNVWVTNDDYKNYTVTKLNPSGSIMGTYPVGSYPDGIAVDASGNVWVVNHFSNTVTKLSFSGSTIGTYSVGHSPIAIAIDASGSAWVTNSDDNTVTELSSFGSTVGTYSTGTHPNGIAVDDSGSIWVANWDSNNVTKLSPSGSIIGTYPVGTNPSPIGDFTGFALKHFVLGGATTCNSQNQCVVGGGGAVCSSNSDCSAAQPSITVTSPNGGENWEVGGTYTISWKYSGFDSNITSKDFLVDLERADNAAIYIGITNTSTGTNNSGSFNWTVPSSIFIPGQGMAPIQGTNYRITVFYFETHVKDYSDALFSIVVSTTHSVCNSQKQCVAVAGAGTNQCNTDADCPAVAPTCNAQNQCVVGGGGAACSTNSDCSNAQPTIPTVTTQTATNITQTTANTNGVITATGGGNATTRGFKYYQSSDCSGTANDLSNTGSFGVGAYSLSLTNLSAGTNYSYKAYATNSSGTGYGSCVSFTTAVATGCNNDTDCSLGLYCQISTHKCMLGCRTNGGCATGYCDLANTHQCTTGCTPNWQCGAWGACINNSQTRTCTDSNNCGVSTGEPATNQTCISSNTVSATVNFDADAVDKSDTDTYNTTSTATTLRIGSTSATAFNDYDAGIDFNVSNIPAGAIITDVKLNIYWNSLQNTTKRDSTFYVYKQTTIAGNADTAEQKFDRWDTGTPYYSSAMSGFVVGTASYDLGATANAAMQNSINGSKIFTVGLSTSGDDSNAGSPNSINSSEAGSTGPILTITYTTGAVGMSVRDQLLASIAEAIAKIAAEIQTLFGK